MNFILIKKIEEDEMLINFLKSFFGKSVRIEDENDYLIIFHKFDNENEIRMALNSLSSDLSFMPYIYLSFNTKNYEKEKNIALGLLENLNSGIYNFKEAILYSNNIKNKKEILDFILEGSQINQEFIKDFALSDLNVSRASKNMYIHRNTLIYKCDKFLNDTGFDLKNFKDMYILYSLVENK